MALEDELLRQRSARAVEIEKLGFRPYGQAFPFTHTVPQILSEYGSKIAEELTEPVHVKVAGRIMTLRRMGKAGFANLQQKMTQRANQKPRKSLEMLQPRAIAKWRCVPHGYFPPRRAA